MTEDLVQLSQICPDGASHSPWPPWCGVGPPLRRNRGTRPSSPPPAKSAAVERCLAESVVIREGPQGAGDRGAPARAAGVAGGVGSPGQRRHQLVPMQCRARGPSSCSCSRSAKPHLVMIAGPHGQHAHLPCEALGWRTVVVDDRGDPDAHPDAGLVVTTLDSRPPRP